MVTLREIFGPRFIGPKGPKHMRSFPGCCHYEENRQNAIDIGNYTYRRGWLPNGPENWWIPLRRNIEHHHYPDFIPYTLYVRDSNGNTKKVVSE